MHHACAPRSNLLPINTLTTPTSSRRLSLMLLQLLLGRRPRTAPRRALRVRIQVHTRRPWTTRPLVCTPSSPIHRPAFTPAVILPMVIAERGPPGGCTESTRTFVTGGGQWRRLGRGWVVPGKYETEEGSRAGGMRNGCGMH